MRKIVPSDQTEIVEMIHDYYVENQKLMPMKVDYDQATTEQWVANALKHPDLIAYRSDDGFILGELSQLTISNTRVGRMGIWYVRPEARNGILALRLVRHFDDEAKERGAVYGRATLDNPAHFRAAEGLYHVAGYKDYSKIYVKEY